jgi:cytochrome c oxidase cbb3-type subunit IV
MSTHSTYETLRHLADSWGLLGMAVLFLVLAAWPFRPSARDRNQSAAMTIFEDDEQ